MGEIILTYDNEVLVANNVTNEDSEVLVAFTPYAYFDPLVSINGDVVTINENEIKIEYIKEL